MIDQLLVLALESTLADSRCLADVGCTCCLLDSLLRLLLTDSLKSLFEIWLLARTLFHKGVLRFVARGLLSNWVVLSDLLRLRHRLKKTDTHRQVPQSILIVIQHRFHVLLQSQPLLLRLSLTNLCILSCKGLPVVLLLQSILYCSRDLVEVL